VRNAGRRIRVAKLIVHSYVEQTMEENKAFDAAGLLEKNPAYQGRLKYWTNELCAQKPQTFDIVLAVRLSAHCDTWILTAHSLVAMAPYCTRPGYSSASFRPSSHSRLAPSAF
jgi:hypothetical protein